MLYPSPISGLIRSRRFGLSLGINVLPPDGKVCSFDCLYCECGFNGDNRPHSPMPSRADIAVALEATLLQLKDGGTFPDVITFSGNGEPTLHPEFPEIISDVCLLRDRYMPQARVTVLSNATQTVHPAIRQALLRADNPVMKLDTVSPVFIAEVDRPTGHYDVESVVDALTQMGGHAQVQTIFLHRGEKNNIGEGYVAPWIEVLKRIKPAKVMIYTIDRPTPDHSLSKATPAELDAIAARVRQAGFPCLVGY